jgi:hypothetical protein
MTQRFVFCLSASLPGIAFWKHCFIRLFYQLRKNFSDNIASNSCRLFGRHKIRDGDFNPCICIYTQAYIWIFFNLHFINRSLLYQFFQLVLFAPPFRIQVQRQLLCEMFFPHTPNHCHMQHEMIFHSIYI